MKKNWLENAEKRIEEKEVDNKRRLAAVKALTEGGKWQWNPEANPKETQKRKKRSESPMRRNPWEPNAHAPEKTRPQKRTTNRAKKKTTKDRGKGDTTVVHSPWDTRPMSALAGSSASAGANPHAPNKDTGAAAAAAPARTRLSTAHISLEPSADSPRRERDTGPKPRTPKSHATPTQEPPRHTHKNATDPQTPHQADDPDTIGDVV